MRVFSFLCISAVVFGAACSSHAQSQTTYASAGPLALSGLKDVYHAGEKVAFKVESTSDVAQRFTCSVEQRVGGAWSEVLLSIFPDDPMKAARVITLRPHESLPFEWDPRRKSPNGSVSTTGEYRLRLDLRVPSNPTPTSSIYSAAFRLGKS
jgi:hypothetical protein